MKVRNSSSEKFGKEGFFERAFQCDMTALVLLLSVKKLKANKINAFLEGSAVRLINLKILAEFSKRSLAFLLHNSRLLFNLHSQFCEFSGQLVVKVSSGGVRKVSGQERD